MTVLSRIIGAIEQFQLQNELELNVLVHELASALNHFKLRLTHSETTKHQADYVDHPWF